MKDPCKDCKDKQIDHWGYFFDLSCGKHSAYENFSAGQKDMLDKLIQSDKRDDKLLVLDFALSQYEVEGLYQLQHPSYQGRKAGIKEVVEWVRSHQLIEPDKDSITRFEPFYQIEEKELKEWGIEEK